MELFFAGQLVGLPTLFAKTLRRHWFQRTYIEQFFILLKHTLQVSQVTTGAKNDFVLKIFRFFFIALHAQKLVVFLERGNQNISMLDFK